MPNGTTTNEQREMTAQEVARTLGIHQRNVERHCTPVRTIRLYTLESVRADLNAVKS